MDGRPRPPAPETPPGAQSAPSSEDHDRIFHGSRTYIGSGGFGHIYQIDSQHVVKEPHDDETAQEVLATERLIFERLGSHGGIIKYCGLHDVATGAIKLEYANDGNLDDYIRTRDPPSVLERAAMIQRLADALLYMYDRGLMPQDIRPENTLVCDGVPKLADFGQGVIYDMKTDMSEDVTDKKLLQHDLLGISTVIWSIAAWDSFYDNKDGEVICSPDGDLRSTHGLMGEPVLQKCWYRSYITMKHFHEDLTLALTSVTSANII